LEANFKNDYNRRGNTFKIEDLDGILVIGEWHRLKLGGLETQSTYPLTIEVVPSSMWNIDNWTAWCRACWHHPQIVVRVAFALGFLGVLLSLIQIILAFAKK
jgi:hypothetical protein